MARATGLGRADRATLAAFLGTVVLAGLNFVAVRFSNRELPPFEGAALRFRISLVWFVTGLSVASYFGVVVDAAWRRPDLDKLQRAVLDALTGVLFSDDGQVVQLAAVKQYGQPGVHIVAEQLQVSPPAVAVDR